MSAADLERRCAALIDDLALAPAGAVRGVRPLSGGVGSDIAVVRLPDRELCVKFALPQLKVAEEWLAPVHRNRTEYAWLEAVSVWTPANAPALYGWSEAENGFAMEYLADGDVTLWKDALLRGEVDAARAAAVGRVLGTIHQRSARAGFDRTRFAQQDAFYALRIEPYLIFTAGRHADLAAPLRAMADALYRADAVLVHGDVSPKNILFRGEEPIFLDAECATVGDPCFDLAFCLNHLMLKAFHQPAMAAGRRGEAQALWDAYSAAVDWEPVAALEARTAALLPALMLARVDGKSPVEYLSDAARDRVRAAAIPLIASPPARLTPAFAAILSSA